jgi:hypothetical protein
MVPIGLLWMPILLSAVLVFVASSVIHMLLPYHNSDYGKVPDEGGLMEALRKFDLPPGEYIVPRPDGHGGMKNPEYVEKRNKGPIVFMTVMPGGATSMGPMLIQWFVYCVVVAVIAAYVAGRALGPGAHYLTVFRFAGCVAFVGYAVALAQRSIWYRQKWSTTFKNTFDGLIYGMLTAGAFGWLWPK